MSIIDDILNVLKGANPEASDEDLTAQATQLAQHPDAASVMSQLSGPPPSAPSAPAIPPSSFDVGVSDNTATQNGNLPSTAAPAPSPTLPPLPQEPATSAAPTPPPATPTSAPAAPPVAAKGTVAPVTVPAMPPTSSDQATRDAAMADALKKRKLSVIPEALAGAGDAINNGLAAYGIKAPTDKEDELVKEAKANFDESKGLLEDKISNDPNSEASKNARNLVLQIAPQMANQPGFNTMTDKELRDKLPLVDTMMKAKATEDSKQLSLKQIQANKDISLGLKNDQQQDKLEQNAKQMVSNLRGDKSLARTEEQRDAASVAYNRLKQVQASGKGLNPVDYADILGQIYKARTGTAPGEQVLKDIHQATAEGSLGKAYTYITGQQAPATSQDITNSLLNMAQSMGQQADKFHEGYMNAHLIKPTHLNDDTWNAIKSTNRGLSFADATGQSSTPTASPANTSGGQRQTAAGHTYTVSQ